MICNGLLMFPSCRQSEGGDINIQYAISVYWLEQCGDCHSGVSAQSVNWYCKVSGPDKNQSTRRSN